MLGKLYALVSEACCEDNPDALTAHELLLPGHLLMRFMHEKLEDCQLTFRDVVRRDAEKNPASVNLQVALLIALWCHGSTQWLEVGRLTGVCLTTCKSQCGAIEAEALTFMSEVAWRGSCMVSLPASVLPWPAALCFHPACPVANQNSAPHYADRTNRT